MSNFAYNKKHLFAPKIGGRGVEAECFFITRNTFNKETKCRYSYKVNIKKVLTNKLYYAYNTVVECIIDVIQLKGVRALISFDSFVADGILPIYLQIILFIKRGLIAGTVKNGEELPSRRYLSALLGVNPNTVQKAFALLEEEGLVSSRAGAKSIISADGDRIEKIREELLLNDIRNIVSSLKQTGLTKEQAARLIADNWD